MKLIDADLIQYEPMLSPKGNGQYEEVSVAYKSQIDDLPTIERKTGKWILTEDDDYEYCTCSECGYQNGENWMNGSDIPFCAMCGADMRGDDHETD